MIVYETTGQIRRVAHAGRFIVDNHFDSPRLILAPSRWIETLDSATGQWERVAGSEIDDATQVHICPEQFIAPATGSFALVGEDAPGAVSAYGFFVSRLRDDIFTGNTPVFLALADLIEKFLVDNGHVKVEGGAS